MEITREEMSNATEAPLNTITIYCHNLKETVNIDLKNIEIEDREIYVRCKCRQIHDVT